MSEVGRFQIADLRPPADLPGVDVPLAERVRPRLAAPHLRTTAEARAEGAATGDLAPVSASDGARAAQAALRELRADPQYCALQERVAEMDDTSGLLRRCRPSSGAFVCDPDKGVTAVMTRIGLAFISRQELDRSPEALIAEGHITLDDLRQGLFTLGERLDRDGLASLTDMCGGSPGSGNLPIKTFRVV